MTHAVVDNATPAASGVEDKNGLIAYITEKEPVMAAAVTTWFLSWLGTILVGHHIIGTDGWTTTTQEATLVLVPIVTLGLGWLVRSVLNSPRTAKLLAADHIATVADLQSQIEAMAKALDHAGVLTDADFGRLQVALTEHSSALIESIKADPDAVAALTPLPAKPLDVPETPPAAVVG